MLNAVSRSTNQFKIFLARNWFRWQTPGNSGHEVFLLYFFSSDTRPLYVVPRLLAVTFRRSTGSYLKLSSCGKLLLDKLNRSGTSGKLRCQLKKRWSYPNSNIWSVDDSTRTHSNTSTEAIIRWENADYCWSLRIHMDLLYDPAVMLQDQKPNVGIGCLSWNSEWRCWLADWQIDINPDLSTVSLKGIQFI